MALVGALTGWLPGFAAAVAYAVKRVVPEEKTGEEKTLTELSATGSGSTLSLENLEELRRVRRDGGGLKDARTSEFFKV
jgi:hypothetical protein